MHSGAVVSSSQWTVVTFTKEIFSLTVLLATSADADNHAAVSAWALVEGESESS